MPFNILQHGSSRSYPSVLIHKMKTRSTVTPLAGKNSAVTDIGVSGGNPSTFVVKGAAKTADAEVKSELGLND